MAETVPVISVVIPTFSRPVLLRKCMDGVLAQRCRVPFEVIVVDDGGTPSAAETLKDVKDDRLKIVRVPNGGPAKARNEGIRRATAAYVAFIDDDCVPEPEWLDAALDAFTDGVVKVHGAVSPEQPANPLVYHFIETGNQPANVTANLVVRREALLSIGGFDEGFPYAAGEDFDLCWRLEQVGESRFAPKARVLHALIPVSWSKRRARPRIYETFFRLYGLHPQRLEHANLPKLAALKAALSVYPPLWIGFHVTAVPIIHWFRCVGTTPVLPLLEELAASCVNFADSFGHVKSYLAAYRRARAEGGKPGLAYDTLPHAGDPSWA